MLLPLLLAAAWPSAAQLTALETEQTRLLYFEAPHSYLAPYAARCLLNSLDFHRRLFDYTPSEPITVFLNDFSDGGNASAGALPFNNVMVQIAPLSFVYETSVANERINSIMSHELVHVVVMDRAAAADRRFRSWFRGKVLPVPEHPETILYFYLTTPRVAAPRWYQEGIAVFLETWMSGGIGRAQGAWDEMVFRSMVMDDSHFYDPLGLVSEGVKIDFQVEVNSYLYGTRFMSYLAHRFSPESLIRWVARADGSKRYYAAQFEVVYGMPLAEAWADWIAWEREFQQANLARIRQHPLTAYEDLSQRALGSVSRAFLDAEAGKLYVAFNYPGVVAHVGAISLSDGAVERLVEVKGPELYSVTSLAWDRAARMLYYTTDNLEYRDLRALDPATGRTRTLIKDARIGELAFNPVDRSLWGVRHLNGYATLVRVPQPYDEWQQVHTWPYGLTLYELDVSPDGRLLSMSVGEINGDQSLQLFEIDRLSIERAEPIATHDFGAAIPNDFVFSPDGRYLYGSSYFTGVSNIFRIEVEDGDGTMLANRQALTNTDTGFFRPLPLGGDELIVFRYTGEGFVPAKIVGKPLEDVNPIVFFGQQIAAEHPVIREWKLEPPDSVTLDQRVTAEGPYEPSRRLRLESLYPVVEGYRDFEAVGLRANLSDPMSLNRSHLTASYTPDDRLPSDERLHLELEYQRFAKNNVWRVGARLNDADFYDLFGPTKTSRKGYSLALGWDRNLLLDKPRTLDLSVDAVYYGDLDTLPDFQNVAAPFDELLTTKARLRYSNLRGSLGRVDDEKGLAWELLAADNYVNDESIPSLVSNLDLGFPLPLEHSSIWLRSSIGGAFGEIDDPFANFFFGGFGNNWVDHGPEKRYREYYSFPGVELNEIGGRTFAKGLLEWNLPPLRLRRVGNDSFYLTWVRTALFAGGIVTNPEENAARQTVRNLGTQVDLRFTLLSRLEMTISIGYAVAFESGRPDRDEVMVSLKVL